MLFHNPFVHSSTMMRASIFDNLNIKYDDAFITAQDYDLWVRLSKVMRLANIPEVLLKLRVHDNSIGSRKKNEQDSNANLIRKRQLQTLGVDLNHSEWTVYSKVCSHEAIAESEVGALLVAFNKIHTANKLELKYNQKVLSDTLTNWWIEGTNKLSRSIGYKLIIMKANFINLRKKIKFII